MSPAILTGLRNPPPAKPQVPKNANRPTFSAWVAIWAWIVALVILVGALVWRLLNDLLLALFSVAIVLSFTSCTTTKTRRVLDDGTVVESATYGLTDRAAYALDAGARRYFRMPVERGAK